ncbi:hypothetical protein U1Q18_046212, partial [Sarracenia purpurea var. burkii]
LKFCIYDLPALVKAEESKPRVSGDEASWRRAKSPAPPPDLRQTSKHLLRRAPQQPTPTSDAPLHLSSLSLPSKTQIVFIPLFRSLISIFLFFSGVIIHMLEIWGP